MPLALSEPVNKMMSPGFALFISISVPSSVKFTDERGAFTLKWLKTTVIKPEQSNPLFGIAEPYL